MVMMQSGPGAALELPGLADLALPLDGYIRVSRVGDRSGESYVSPDIQTNALTRWAKDKGVSNLMLHDPEENVSGGTMDRPIFNEIMRRIRNGESGGVVVYKLDRFARTLVGGLTTLQELTERGALFASATEARFDFTTSDGRLFLQMNLMMAEYFRERTKESWASSLGHAVNERGVHIAPTLAYGYDKDDAKRLIPNKGAPFVLRAFEFRAQGWPMTRIAEWLNENAPPRRDANRWTPKSVEAMLRRRVYLGMAHWGEHRNPHAHAALVPADVWEKAQQRVQHYSKKLKGDEVALLHGVLRCAGCRFCLSRARHVSGKYDRHYYRCRKVHQSGRCHAPAMVRADGMDGVEAYVESMVCAELDRRYAEFDEIAATTELHDAILEREAAEADLNDMKADTTARRRLGKQWLEFVEPYVAAVEQAQERVASLQSEHRVTSSGITSDEYLALPRDERVLILREWIDAVFIRHIPGARRGPQATPIGPERVHVLWGGTGPTDLPSSNARSVLAPWSWPKDELASGVLPSQRSA